MNPSQLVIVGVTGLPEVQPGMDLPSLIEEAIAAEELTLQPFDLLVVAQKIVSKAEGRLLSLNEITPSPRAEEWASSYGRDPRLVEAVLRESRTLLKMEQGIIISETQHGFVCANAGVDLSNSPEGQIVLLPEDPDRSAEQIREHLTKRYGVQLAVIVSDTFGRPWREGLVNVALGISGMNPFRDFRGLPDRDGRPLSSTRMAAADELAAAAGLVMGKTEGIPVALIRGFKASEEKGSGRDLLRASKKDLFR